MSINGIFILSDKSDENIIEDCQKLLLDLKSDAKVTGLKTIEFNSLGRKRGIKVLFDCSPFLIRELIKRKFLNDTSTIHSLTTTLSIEAAFPQSEDKFKEDLKAEIENMAPVKVLDISKVPTSTGHSEISSGKWIIELDVPELEDLPVFRIMGLPNRMDLLSPVNGESIRVRFYCRLCRKDGHVQLQCAEVAHRDDSGEIGVKPTPQIRVRIGSEMGSASHSFTPDAGESSGSLMPQGIKDIVLQVKNGVLDVEQLEAFVNLSQDKPDLTGFVRDYFTNNVEGLLQQLKEISRRYNQQSKKNSLAEMNFMIQFHKLMYLLKSQGRP